MATYVSQERLTQYDSLIKSYITNYVNEGIYDDSELKTLIETNATNIATNAAAIEVLNGDSATEGSVAYQIAEIVAGADEDFDTLKEIADWISSHADSASAMNSAITANADAIDALEALIGTFDTDSYATLVAYIDAAAEEAAADALSDAKDYADGLASNYATAAQGALADTAVQSVTTGTSNGTISVDGTDVAVYGLGSAAYLDLEEVSEDAVAALFATE